MAKCAGEDRKQDAATNHSATILCFADSATIPRGRYMYRRNFIRKALTGMAGAADFAVTVRNGFAAGMENVVGAARSPGKAPASARDGKFFPTDLPERGWREFPASGFAHSVCGANFPSRQPPRCG